MNLKMAGCICLSMLLLAFTLPRSGAQDATISCSLPADAGLAPHLTGNETSAGATKQASGQQPASAANPADPAKHKLGSLDISINWRTRAEGWNWFQGKSGNSDYGFWDSLLRVGIGQSGEHFDWFFEGEQVAILNLPGNAVVASPQGQLGIGGSYYAANNNNTDPANGFVKQAFPTSSAWARQDSSLAASSISMELKSSPPILCSRP